MLLNFSVTTLADFLLSIGVALAIGLFLAVSYTYKTRYTKSFVVTLASLPAVVSVIIMMVNGNIGAGVAVAGAFSLVRFRSVPGSAKEIGAIFLAMAAGLAVGMGYWVHAGVFTLVLGGFNGVLTHSGLGEKKVGERVLRITVPEDLDYTGAFDDLFEMYTCQWHLVGVKTTHLGSLFKLTYQLTLKTEDREKALIDAMRCRNGNLEIYMTHDTNATGEL